MRLLREELQLLQESGSYVGEVVKAMDKKKVLVKVFLSALLVSLLLYNCSAAMLPLVWFSEITNFKRFLKTPDLQLELMNCIYVLLVSFSSDNFNRAAMTGSFASHILCYGNITFCLVSLTEHPPPRLARNMVRRDICRHSYALERGLVIGFCGQPHYCYRPYYPTARFPSPSSYMGSDEPFPDRSRPISC